MPACFGLVSLCHELRSHQRIRSTLQVLLDVRFSPKAFEDVDWIFTCQKAWFTPITPLNVSLIFLCLLMSLNGLINNCNWKASWLILPYTIPPNQKSRMDTFTLSTSLFPPQVMPPSCPSELAQPRFSSKTFYLTIPVSTFYRFFFCLCLSVTVRDFTPCHPAHLCWFEPHQDGLLGHQRD